MLGVRNLAWWKSQTSTGKGVKYLRLLSSLPVLAAGSVQQVSCENQTPKSHIFVIFFPLL